MAKPLTPETVNALRASFDSAVAFQRQGNAGEAEKIYTRILKAIPNQFETLQLLAELKMASGKTGEAFRLMTAAVAANPRSGDAQVHLGLVLRALKRDADALAAFDKALAIDANHIDALGHRSDLLLSAGRPQDALTSCDRILQIAPGHPAALGHRGAALAALGKYPEALADFEAVLAAAPGDPVANYNRANTLFSLGRYADAFSAYSTVVVFQPQNADAWNNRGNTLVQLNRHTEALESFARAIAIRPDYADAHLNRALAMLALGDYAGGFSAYEWRTRKSGVVRQSYGKARWLGEFSLERKTILLHAEQGLGDTIQFARYIPLLARMGATVLLEVQPELKDLLAASEGVADVFARGDKLPPFDVHSPLGSLPLALKTTTASVPSALPYLAASELRIAKWQARLGAHATPRVAIAWAGNAAHINDRNRSIPLGALQPLWRSGVTFISLQRDLRAGDEAALQTVPNVVNLGGELADLADTAAVLSLCDLVVTVDTSVAHLAGAMGRPVWVLLPFSPDWRWTLEGERSPWYPDARLIRQPRQDDWDTVIGQVAHDLPAALGY